jgi:outer membrane protein assembly factor BamE (lipoprotein component of BamABCDE complex)
MKSKSLALVVMMSLGLTMTGCVISVDGDGYNKEDWENREYDNRKKLSTLRLGMGLGEITNYMGTPDFNELYNKGDDRYQVLFYRTNRRSGDGFTTKDECTPLVIKNGELAGWGETAYRKLS